LVPRSEREIRIKAHIDAADEKVNFFDFRSGTVRLPVIRVEASLPVYRMENYRTFTGQREIIAKDKRDTSYFLMGQELQSIQQEQHEILAKLATKGKSNANASIKDVLAIEGQREPLLLSSTGVVINGNRRLAAMRELLVSDVQDNARFNHISCMILPADTTTNEIVEIEANLQAKPETKLDYDWIGDAQLVNRLVNLKGGTKEVADLLNRTEADIKRTIQALNEGDLYLKEWINSEGYYSNIASDEQLFKDLPKLLLGKNQAMQDASRVIAWTLLDNKDKISGRVYSYNAAIGDLAADVLDRMAEDLDIPLGSSEQDDDDGFAIDLTLDEESPDYSNLIAALKNQETKELAVDALIEACQSALETQKGQQSGRAALKAVTQAHAKLVSVDISRADPATRPTIKKQLSSISDVVTRLLGKLDDTND